MAPDFLANANTGAGVSSLAEDILVPLIYILQKGSPQVNKKEDSYIDDAEPGDIWLRPGAVVKGEEGIIFQPCIFWKDWVEWVPDRGGYAGRFAFNELPDDVEMVPDPRNPSRQIRVRENGNTLVETRYYAGYVYRDNEPPMPFVIPLSSTGHTFGKTLMNILNSKQINGGKADSFSSLYRLRTHWQKNAMGDWYTWGVTDIGWVPDVATYELGKKLHLSMKSGEKRAENVDEAVPGY
jgi:hypothetical protein